MGRGQGGTRSDAAPELAELAANRPGEFESVLTGGSHRVGLAQRAAIIHKWHRNEIVPEDEAAYSYQWQDSDH